MTNALLAVAASFCLAVALIQSWLIVGALGNPGGPVAKIFVNTKELIRSHIDFLMMSQFLFIFFGLFRLMSLTAPVWLVTAIAFGSFFNPFAFFVRSMKPSYIQAPPRPFLGLLTVSCIATTIGYAAMAWIIASAALRAA